MNHLIARGIILVFSVIYFPVGLWLNKMVFGELTWLTYLALFMLSCVGVGLAFTLKFY